MRGAETQIKFLCPSAEGSQHQFVFVSGTWCDERAVRSDNIDHIKFQRCFVDRVQSAQTNRGSPVIELAAIDSAEVRAFETQKMTIGGDIHFRFPYVSVRSVRALCSGIAGSEYDSRQNGCKQIEDQIGQAAVAVPQDQTVRDCSDVT